MDIHDRRPVVLKPEDAWRWMDPKTPVEALLSTTIYMASLAMTSSTPTEMLVKTLLEFRPPFVRPYTAGNILFFI